MLHNVTYIIQSYFEYEPYVKIEFSKIFEHFFSDDVFFESS